MGFSYKPKHLCQFLAKSNENFFKKLSLNCIFFLFEICYYRMPIVYLMLIRKRLKIRKKWIKVKKSVSSRPKNQKIFFRYEDMAKNDTFLCNFRRFELYSP